MAEYFTGKTAAEYLTETHGIECDHRELHRMRQYDVGPDYKRAGERTIIYTQAALDAWAREQKADDDA